MRRSAATRPRRRNGGGGPEEGGVVRRRGEGVCGGGPVPFLSLPFSRSLPHPLVSLLGSARPSSVPGAAASPAAAPRRAFSFVSALPRAPAFPAEGGSRVGGGACAPLPFAFGAGRPPVAVPPPARCPRRVSGPGGAAAGPRGASPGLGSAPPRGGLGASAHAGLPPSSAASRRPPWTVVSRSVGCPLGTPPYHSASLLPDPASGLGFRVGLLSFPASAPPPSRALARSCPASRRSPPPPVARRGLGCGCGEGRGG